jgi:lipopolysaccharide export LptBFGC system permease protein LptF
MNRTFYIIFVPVVLVVAGYLVVFRAAGMPVPWLQLLVPSVALATLMAWMSRRRRRKEART